MISIEWAIAFDNFSIHSWQCLYAQSQYLSIFCTFRAVVSVREDGAEPSQHDVSVSAMNCPPGTMNCRFPSWAGTVIFAPFYFGIPQTSALISLSYILDLTPDTWNHRHLSFKELNCTKIYITTFVTFLWVTTPGYSAFCVMVSNSGGSCRCFLT